MEKTLTLSFIRQGNQLLLGFKKRGFGVGRWNGFGGKVEEDETIIQAAAREIKEECGLTAINLEHFGLIKFIFQNSGDILNVHFFQTREFTGQAQETEEMKPQWFNEDSIPFIKMWPDDPLWFPLFLANKKFEGVITFADMDNIVDHKIKEI